MKKMLMLIAVSMLPLQAATAASWPVASAQVIADQIEASGRAEPLVEFVRGTALLTPASRTQLVELVALLREDPQLRIEIGFAPGDGLLLADERARALREALLALAAPADRLGIKAGRG